MSYGYGGYNQHNQNNYGYNQGWGAQGAQGTGYHDQPQNYNTIHPHSGGLDQSGLPVMPSMSATFVPGGDDDWTMPAPELISPAPQRIMPEVPTNIADSIGTMENRVAAQTQTQTHMSHPGAVEAPTQRDLLEEPSWSPFPKLQNPGPNIPPTDDEKERYLESARVAVLSSDDPDTQLAWAQDALNYVDTSLQYLTRTSEDGRPQTPAVEYQLRTDALNIVNFLADQHHPKAEFMRGTWLEFGKLGFRVDRREAFRSYARAAEKGYSRAEYRMGMQYENSNEPMKAIKHYTQGASLGDSASNYRLGMMTLLGQHGQTQDYGRGVMLVRQAAETADENAPQGAFVYGLMLARDLPGLSIPEIYLNQDLHQAKIMIEKAAFLGFAKAQVKMAQAYELCQLGCSFDPALSLHYNALASRQGEPEADMAISKWFLCGHDGVFMKNEELAFKYAKQAAKAGLPTAEFAMGYFYEIGMQVPADLGEARRWYAKAAANGNKDAKGRLEGISRSSTLSRKDHENLALPKIRASRSVRVPNRPASTAVDMPNPIIPPAGSNLNQPQFSQFNNAAARPTTPGFINPATGAIQPFEANTGALPPRTSSITPYPPSPTTGAKQGLGPPGRPATAIGQTQRPVSVGPNAGPVQRPQTTVPSGVLLPAGTYPGQQGGRGGPLQRPASAFSGPSPQGSGFPTTQPLRPFSQAGRGAPVGNVPYPGYEAPLPAPKVEKPLVKPAGPVEHGRRTSLTPQQQQPVAGPAGPRPSPTPKPQTPAPTIKQQNPTPAPTHTAPAPVSQPAAQSKPLPQPQTQTKPPPPAIITTPAATAEPPKSPPLQQAGGNSGKKRFEDYDWLPPQQKEQECVVM
ncbi:hypothetical protein ABW19_dt0203100 [Dactylella cylindrospora]|nr:hypothetical protein ABW19_dt0203100 [Dactylella cylindrospora]